MYPPKSDREALEELDKACESGDLAKIQELLKSNPNINLNTRNFLNADTPLMTAIKNGAMDIAEFLLDKTDVELRNRSNKYALRQAIDIIEDDNALEVLADKKIKASAQLTGKKKEIKEEIKKQYINLMKELILKADINDGPGQNRLWYAIKYFKDDKALAEKLVKNGKYLDDVDEYGENVLAYAIYWNSTEFIKALTKHGMTLEHPGTSFYNKYRFIKSIGHQLGLTQKIELVLPSQSTPTSQSSQGLQSTPTTQPSQATTTSQLIDTEGNPAIYSIALLNTLVKEYIKAPTVLEGDKQSLDKVTLERFENISKALVKAQDYFMSPETVTAKTLLEDFEKNNKCVVLPTRWSSSPSSAHMISVVLYKDYLVIVNRGEGKLSTTAGTLFFKIPENKKKEVNEDFIDYLMKNEPKDRTQAMVMNRIKEVVDISKPIFEIPTKDQKHGTCSFVNNKGAIEVMLFFEAQQTLLEKSKEKGAVKDPFDAEIVNQAKVYSRQEYKKFTNLGVRNYGVKQIVDKMKSFPLDQPSLEKGYYITLMVALLTAHHGYAGSPEKMKEALIREKYLLDALPELVRISIFKQAFFQKTDFLTPALLAKNDELVKLLCKSGADQFPALKRALDQLPKNLKEMIDLGLDVNARNSEHVSILSEAVQKNKADALKMLLDAGAKINTPDVRGKYPFSHATSQNIKDLLFEGLFVELSKAILSKNSQEALEIIKLPGKHVLSNSNNDTFLHLAARKVPLNYELLKTLLEAKPTSADLFAANRLGETPLEILSNIKDDTLARLLTTHLQNTFAKDKAALFKLIDDQNPNSNQILKFLLDHDQVLSSDIKKLLHTEFIIYVFRNGTVEQLKILLENPRIVENINKVYVDFDYLETMVHSCIRNNWVKKLKLLLEKGANPNAKNDEGDTALHLAMSRLVSSQDVAINIINDLLKAKPTPVDLFIKDNQGQTALDLARAWGKSEVADFLVKCQNEQSETLKQKSEFQVEDLSIDVPSDEAASVETSSIEAASVEASSTPQVLTHGFQLEKNKQKDLSKAQEKDQAKDPSQRNSPPTKHGS